MTTGVNRVIIHWTAGAHKPSGLDLQHYHFVIDGDGVVHEGKFPVSANAGSLVSGKYAAHTKGCNTGSIGVALAAMAGAVERPFNAGSYPITPAQEAALTKLLVKLGDEYRIPVTRQTMLTHAEVQPTLGIKQNGKWDIRWLCGMGSPGHALTVGDIIRSRVSKERPKTPDPKPVMGNPISKPSWLSAILKLLGIKK